MYYMTQPCIEPVLGKVWFRGVRYDRYGARMGGGHLCSSPVEEVWEGEGVQEVATVVEGHHIGGIFPDDCLYNVLEGLHEHRSLHYALICEEYNWNHGNHDADGSYFVRGLYDLQSTHRSPASSTQHLWRSYFTVARFVDAHLITRLTWL